MAALRYLNTQEDKLPTCSSAVLIGLPLVLRSYSPSRPYASPRARPVTISAMCRTLGACKNSVGRRRRII